jgi:hypothetical protein
MTVLFEQNICGSKRSKRNDYGWLSLCGTFQRDGVWNIFSSLLFFSLDFLFFSFSCTSILSFPFYPFYHPSLPLYLSLHSFVFTVMNFNIFKPKQKTPHDLAKHLKDYIHKLDGPDKRKVMWYGKIVHWREGVGGCSHSLARWRPKSGMGIVVDARVRTIAQLHGVKTSSYGFSLLPTAYTLITVL